MAIRNGSLTRVASNQIDSVGLKSIFDKFKAMVKERQEELRCFVGEAVSPLSSNEIVRIYEIFLSSLSVNSKPIITDLTIIAGDQQDYAEGIATAICVRIIEVAVDQKLPSLYLLDSIVKNIGKDYIKYFSVHLPQVFCEAYTQGHPSMQSAMRHLFGTWSTVFPLSILQRIEAKLQFSPPILGQSSSGQNSLRASESPRPAHGIHVNPKYLDSHRSLSPSVDEFRAANSLRVAASPPNVSTNYSLNRRMDREEEASEVQPANWQRNVKTSYLNPRDLINAYGVDEREKTLKRKQTWQNTEEEEFDWQDVTSSLGDRKHQRKDISSSHHPPSNSVTRHMFPTDFTVTDPRDTWQKSRFSSVHEPPVVEDAYQYDPARGLISNTGVLLSITDKSDFGRESLINQQLQSHLSAKGGSTNFPSSSSLPSVSTPHHMQMHLRGLNEQHLHSNRPMSQLNFPQLPNHRPGLHPNFLLLQDVPKIPHSVPAHSYAVMPPMPYRYPAPGPRMQLPFPGMNASNRPFHMQGPPFSQIHGPLPITTQASTVAQNNTSQVGSNSQGGGAMSGLFSSLMAQGLISMTKQEDSLGVEFDLESLKVRHESTITALYTDLPRQCTTCGLRFKTQEEHSNHMDWHVTKNRTLKNRKTKPSPKWFVNTSIWLHSAEAVGTEAPSSLLAPDEKYVEKEDDEEVSVPADEDQNSCALCGERFDDFYSDEMEEWMYKGAVYMHAPAELTVGMDRSQLGPIVHAKCKFDSHGVAS